MGHKERRLHQQSLLKEQIMNAALEIAEANGWTSVSMRKIADRIEYSTQKVYELFSSKDDLILSLVRKGIALLTRNMKDHNHGENPKESIYAMIKSYYKFAWENKALYRIMYGLDGVPFGVEETQPKGMEIGYIVCELLQKQFPDLSNEETFNKVGIIWGAMHGIISLSMAGHILGGQEKAELLIDQSIETVLKSLS
ncbi:TetR/AcrR family transcriptional regulator [Shimazuella alba]|uniref:TetR family transcriptional regulator n=1 Tax=Shimazuella alba TaxID=2690964 RepID=A0A6I4VVY0_9BACL|nr:TetR/AcrR family transcriptional regulator [Shimazuella alba]MXQ55677.1 TetR family transcriptional regulator [Shimazuella alba]